MTMALIYARVSSQEQAKGWSPETQLEACRAYAVQHGMDVAGVYQDAESGSTVERAGFQELMHAIRRGDATSVIIYQTDRLHRDLAHAMITRKELQRLGVELHTVKRGKAGSTPEEQFADNIDDLLAELERARIIERTNRGKRAKMESGRVLGAGPAPYGYQYIGAGRDRRLEIDESTAPTVREIFAWYAYGDGGEPLSVNAIADRLTERGVPSPADSAGRETWHKQRPAGTWTRNHVYPLLNQTAYSGTYTLYRRKRIGKTRSIAHKPTEHFHVSVPAIVDPATYDAVQQRLALGRSQSRGHHVHDYLLSRHIRCACGYKAHGRVSNSARDRLRLWYVCNGRVRRLTAQPCALTMPWFRAETVDAIAWQYLAGLLRDDAALEDRIARQQRQQHAPKATPDRNAILARRAKAERAKARLLDLYEAEEIDRQEWRKRTAAQEAQIAAITAELAALDAPAPDAPPPMPARVADALRALAADVRARLDTLPFEGRRKIVDALAVQATLQVRETQKAVQIESILGVDLLPLP